MPHVVDRRFPISIVVAFTPSTPFTPLRPKVRNDTSCVLVLPPRALASIVEMAIDAPTVRRPVAGLEWQRRGLGRQQPHVPEGPRHFACDVPCDHLNAVIFQSLLFPGHRRSRGCAWTPVGSPRIVNLLEQS
jgi:hypothetical protein